MDRSLIEQIKTKLDIVSVIGEYLPSMKKAGRNYFALCPFHNEKSASFCINEEIQRYKCFGCGENGDLITFIEKIEGIDFPKALEIAAKKAGITIEKVKYNKGTDKQKLEEEQLLKVNRLVAEYFHYILTKHQSGQIGRDYVAKRQLRDEEVKKFMIGYAPKGYENLKNFLKAKGYDMKKMVEWSLLVEKNNKIYDKFRNRLMFPIFNHVGDIVGFTGRVINPDDIPKYLNSAETPVYKKSNVVYGLFQSKEEIRKTKKAIIVEGNVDVPMAHKFEITNVVAPMGTALTIEQLKLIKRYADEIIFCFDTDQAGEKALIRAFEMAEQHKIYSKVLNIGNYQDLDEILKADPKGTIKLIESTESVIDNLISRLLKRMKLDSPKMKSDFVNTLIPYIRLVKDKVEQAGYVQKLAMLVELSEELVWNEVKNNTTTKPRSQTDQNIVISQAIRLNNNLNRKELHIIGMLLQFPFLRSKQIDWNIISSERLLDTYQHLINATSIDKGIETLPEEDQNLATDLVMNNLGDYQSEYEIEQDLNKSIKDLAKRYYTRLLGELKKELLIKEQAGEDISDLLAEQQELLAKLK